MNLVIVIPAYKPTEALPQLVHALADQKKYREIIVVDDGSGPVFLELFEKVRQVSGAHVEVHATNLGKGAALKTGINTAFVRNPDCQGVVTVDADGQHACADIESVASFLESNPYCLILGARQFEGNIPLKSKIGNQCTIIALRVLVGQNLQDTQTGLRGIPACLAIELLKIKSRGYEFELDMLIYCKQLKIPIREVGIQTIYIDDNKSSHFNPIMDSLKIYFALLRFTAVSLTSALLDGTIFALSYYLLGCSILVSQVAARLISMVYNFLGVRYTVFYSNENIWKTFLLYLLLVIFSGAASYGLIWLILSNLEVPTIFAKVIAESIVFMANFVIQRDLIFQKSKKDTG